MEKGDFPRLKAQTIMRPNMATDWSEIHRYMDTDTNGYGYPIIASSTWEGPVAPAKPCVCIKITQLPPTDQFNAVHGLVTR